MDLVWGMKPQTAKRKTYPSDISREQFELIREDLENYKRKTKPREVDLYDVFCGLLYVLKNGCQWRMVPKRWVVERSFAGLEKCRRLWKNCERKPNTSLQFMALAFLTILLRRS